MLFLPHLVKYLTIWNVIHLYFFVNGQSIFITRVLFFVEKLNEKELMVIYTLSISSFSYVLYDF
ncbi:hypothetical protein AC624_17670 [Bacillus sp. FJAT-27238]|nr:hypothetical protein AC624_17670 [Bacillus sp. FJAT-27238]